jgi:hypothetical protein
LQRVLKEKLAGVTRRKIPAVALVVRLFHAKSTHTKICMEFVECADSYTEKMLHYIPVYYFSSKISNSAA